MLPLTLLNLVLVNFPIWNLELFLLISSVSRLERVKGQINTLLNRELNIGKLYINEYCRGIIKLFQQSFQRIQP